jgi:uncharacterized delta-60 repeat protein
VRTDFGRHDKAQAVLLQPDGKIVVGGYSGRQSSPYGYDFALARYLPDGTPDPAFGTGGIVVTNFGAETSSNTDDWLHALALQPDGKIVAVGRGSFDFNPSLGVARYNADGTLDATFGTGGRTSLRVLGGAAIGWDVKVRPDGRILVAADAANGGSTGGYQTLALVRLLSNGAPDGSFGFQGVRLEDVGVFFPRALDVASDGTMYVAGMYAAGLVNETRVYQFTADGTQVQTYAGGGYVTVATGGSFGQQVGALLQPNGNLLVGTTTGGPTYFGSGSWTVASLLPGGSFDPAFGTNGKVKLEPGVPDSAVLADVALAPDGDVALGGTVLFAGADTGYDMAAARLNGVPAPAPVAQVLVWGSRWRRRFFDALAAAGLGEGGLAVPAFGAAPAPLAPWANVDRVSVRFAADAPVTAGDLAILGTRLPRYDPTGFSYDPQTHTATWSLPRPVVADRLRMTLSGRAAAGGYRADVAVLGGDVNRNGIVTMSDLFDLRAHLGRPGAYDVFYDVDGSGTLDAADLAAARRLWPSRLPS